MAFPKIHPLHLGNITRRKMIFGYFLEPDVIIDAPIIAWYIETEAKKILVDTGGGDPALLKDPRFHPYNRGEQTLENALKKLGVSRDDIDIVIATHLHWDHCGENRFFPNAQVIVQEAELEAARNPFPIQHGYVSELIENIDYTVISGDVEIAPGIKTILAPGHTYGMQGVLVEAEHDRYFIAGDSVCLFLALESDPWLIGGIYVDLKLCYETLEKIKNLSAYILPGHDIKVFEKEVYS